MENTIDFILHELERIQSIPSPTFNEGKRGEYLLSVSKNYKLQSVEMDSIGNVYGFLAGGKGRTACNKCTS